MTNVLPDTRREPIHDAINYINVNLTAALSLEALADHVHFSPYHFHRLFLLCTGEAPMEYVRRQRLRAASRDLVSIKLNIIEIAAKYRFESQDGFCRTFKRYYGITPGKYRKLNALVQQPGSHKRFEEVHTIMYDMNMYDRLACSRSDKEEALNTLDKVLELSEKAKCSGLLSLEPEIDSVQQELFKKLQTLKKESLKLCTSSGIRGKSEFNQASVTSDAMEHLIN